jgi:hypothetical protein
MPGTRRSAGRPFSEAKDTIRRFDEPGYVGRCYPLTTELRQIIISHPTGDSASSSNMKRDPLLTRLAEQLASRRQAETLEMLSNVELDELSRVAGEHQVDRVSYLEGAVDGQVQWDGRPGWIRSAAGDHEQGLHGPIMLRSRLGQPFLAGTLLDGSSRRSLERPLWIRLRCSNHPWPSRL